MNKVRRAAGAGAGAALKAEEVGDFGAIFRFFHKVVGSVDANHGEETNKVGSVFCVILEGLGRAGIAV